MFHLDGGKNQGLYSFPMHDDVDRMPLKELSCALALEKNPEKIKDFLVSLLTTHEVVDISSRWTLVRLIERGVSQRDIASDLGLSLCKITRGSKELKKENSPFAHMIRIYQENQANVE